MVRPIDAVQVLNDINWHHKPTPVSEFESGFNRGLNQAMWIITHAPTLTPPNEWVSVEESLPEEKQRVIVRCERVGTSVGGILWGNWMTDIGPGAGKVTHWMPLPAPPGKDNNVPTKAQNEPLTIEQLREMDGEPVWVEEVKHWALIDIEKNGQWAGIPFAVWAENGANFTYNIEGRELHCFRRPPEGIEDARKEARED